MIPEEGANLNRTPRRAIVVLGMHRAGTSLCMNILNQLGVRLDTDLISANQHNERGFFESRAIMHLNEKIFRVLGIAWHTLFPSRLREGWAESPDLQPVRQQLSQLIQEKLLAGNGLWGFKDPRLCLLLPLYEQVFADLQIQPSYVVCVRNPGAIAASLERRNGFPPLLSELLWMDHTFRAIREAGAGLKAVVHYEDWFKDAHGAARSLASALELKPHDDGTTLENRLGEIVVRELDHWTGAKQDFALKSTEKLYQFLRDGKYREGADELAEVQRGLELGLFAPVALCQLFWRTAQLDHFTEANSCCVYTDNLPRRRVVRLELPTEAENLTGLRLDPSDSPGSAQLFSIKLVDLQNRTLWQWNGDAETTRNWEVRNMLLVPHAERGITAHFITDEPSLTIPFEEIALDGAWKGGSVQFEFEPLGISAPPPPALPTFQNELLKMHRVLARKTPQAEVACQLFWRTADCNQFMEANSCSSYNCVSSAHQVVRLPIPSEVRGGTGLRIDPSNQPGLMRIDSIRLLDSGSEMVWEWDGAAGTMRKWQSFNLNLMSQLEDPGVLAHFQTDDPVLILPVSEAELDSISGKGGTVEFGFAWLGGDELTQPQPEAMRRDDRDGVRNRLLAFPSAHK